MNILKSYIIILFLLINKFLFSENIQTNQLNNYPYYNYDYFNTLKFKKNNYNIYLNDNYSFKDLININNSIYSNEFKIESRIRFNYFNEIEKYKFENKEENLLRRSEIIFFGSLTFAAFGGWFFLSVFNVLIYEEPFGKLRQEQFLPLFLGSSLISISIVLSDLFINIRPKLKKIQIY